MTAATQIQQSWGRSPLRSVLDRLNVTNLLTQSTALHSSAICAPGEMYR
jgi:hypothetical protein